MCSCPGPDMRRPCTRWSGPNRKGRPSWTCPTGKSGTATTSSPRPSRALATSAWRSTPPAAWTCAGCPPAGCGPSGTGSRVCSTKRPGIGRGSWHGPAPAGSRPTRPWSASPPPPSSPATGGRCFAGPGKRRRPAPTRGWWRWPASRPTAPTPPNCSCAGISSAGPAGWRPTPTWALLTGRSFASWPGSAAPSPWPPSTIRPPTCARSSTRCPSRPEAGGAGGGPLPPSRATGAPTASPTPSRRWARRRGSRSSGPPGSRPAPPSSGPGTAGPAPATSASDRCARPPAPATTQTPPTPATSRRHAAVARSGPLASTSEGGQSWPATSPPSPSPRTGGPPATSSRRAPRSGPCATATSRPCWPTSTTTASTTRTRTCWPRRAGGGRPWAGRWWRCGCGPASAGPAPPPTPNTGAAGLLAAQVTPRLDGLLAVAVAAGLGWRLRFRPSPDTLAWRRGTAGERRTARLLAPLERRGWAILHDLAIPDSAANIDHLVIGPGGVLVVDSKQYRGRLQVDRDGMLWHGRHLLVSALRKVLWQADQADEVLGVADIQVAVVVAAHGAAVPWGVRQADGVTIVPARRLPDLLQALPPILGPERVAWLADRARLRFHPAA